MPDAVKSSVETPQANETTTPETATEEASSLRELAKLFTLDDQADPAETPAGDDKKPAEKVKPKTLAQAAERLGVEVKDLYDLEIPSDQLKGLTLGKLKDHMVERENFTTRSLKLEEDAAQKEAEFERANLELQTLLGALPKDAIKPEIREAVRQKHEATLKIERERTLQTIPEWKDEKVRTEELAGMVEHLTGFGFPASYLKSVTDHRALKFIRASWQRETRLRKALELVTEKKPANLGKGKPGAPQTRTGSKPMSRQEQEMQRYLRAVTP
jgi:hypothetical protein